MIIIRPNTAIATQFNVFTVPGRRQQQLIDYLSHVAKVAHEVDGWISPSLHRGLDGTRAVNCAQSADRDAARRVIDHLNAKDLLERNKAFGKAQPGTYEVAFTLER